MSDINFERLTDTPFRTQIPVIFSDGNYIYYLGNNTVGSQTLTGDTFRYSENEGWISLGNSGITGTKSRGIFFNGYYWLLRSNTFGNPNLVYRSSDCINWTYVGNLPGSTYGGYSVRLYYNFAWCIHNDRIYFTGYNNGSNYTTGSNSVLSTVDFVNFTIHRYHDQPDGLGYPKRSNCGFYSIGGVLYVLGGEPETGSSGNLTDHWRSLDDGSTWELITSAFDNNAAINGYLSVNGTGSSQCKNQLFVGEDFYIFNESNAYYTTDGVNFNFLNGDGIETLGNTYNHVYYQGRFYEIGININTSPYEYSDFYRTYETFYPSDASMSFEYSVNHSPSPAYIRLIDTSDISSLTSATDYTRIWSITNNRTSATTYYSTSAESLDFSVTGIYGDTFSISLSASF